MKTLYVINPNSSNTVTDGIAQALSPLYALAKGQGVRIDCLTLAEGPPGIESQTQADLVIAPMLHMAAGLKDAAGFVVACFGDPGLHALRDRTSLPVLGIQECAVMTALTLGQRFGVIAILPASVPRHLRAFGAMGVRNRLAGDRALGLGVADLASEAKTRARLIDVGRSLRDTDGADTLILGCTGMARYRDILEDATGLPVVEPCQAAVATALGHIALNQSHNPGGADATPR
ncbi:MAG: aspartate/glutamate racemase family protein [Pseudomonadota bacterium]